MTGSWAAGQLIGIPFVDDRHGGREGVERVLHRELYLGCLWNMNVLLSACHTEPLRVARFQYHGNAYGKQTSEKAENSASDQASSGTQCYTAKISGHDFQEKSMRFYSNEPYAVPPLEEAMWLVSLPSNTPEETSTCPGIHAVPLCMMAEVRFSHGGDDLMGRFFLRNAWNLLREFRTAPNGSFAYDHYRTTMAMWPIRAACSRAKHARHLALAARPDTSLGVAIVHCNDDLTWLQGLSFPINTRFWVYLKCPHRSLPSFCEIFHCIDVSKLDTKDSLSDECGGYLYHIQQNFYDLPVWNLFLQDDAYRHLHLSYLNIVLKSLDKGVVERVVSPFFLHLNNDRHLAYWTPCLHSAMQALGLPPAATVATYCCSQFLVHRSLVRIRNLSFYRRADHMLRKMRWRGLPGCSYSDSGDGNQHGLSAESAFNSRPCYMLEFLWHMIFGQKAKLPRREEDDTLPLIFRFSLIPSTVMPLPDFSSFLKAHTPG